MRIVNLGQANIRSCNFFGCWPKFTKLFLLNPPKSLSINFVSSFQYLNQFLRYSRWKLKVVQNCTKFWTFLPSQILRRVVPPKSCT